MNKLVLVGGGLLVIAAGAWFYSQKSAEDEVRKQLADANLTGVVTYEDLSYNPVSGTLTIYEPKVDLESAGIKDDDFRIEAIRINDVDNEEGTPTRLHLEVIGLQYDILDLARQNPDLQVPGAEGLDITPLEMLVTLGYRAMESNFNIEYDYEPADGTLDLNLVAGTKDMGEINFTISLGNVSQQIFKLIAEMSNMATGNMAGLELLGRLGPVMETVEKITLANLRLSYDDDQLIKRMKRLEEVDYEYTHQEERPEDDLDSLYREIHNDLLETGVPDAMAKGFAENIVNFVRNPEHISFSTNIKTPVRFSNLFGKSPGSTLTLLNAEVES
jgi:hypothetical protein